MLLPDNTYLSEKDYELIQQLQIKFMYVFIKERTRSLLAFPVVTANMKYSVEEVTTEYGTEIKKTLDDSKFSEDCARLMSQNNCLFIYTSDTVDSLASCCRLKNKLIVNEETGEKIDKNTFASTIGGLGVDTGSKRVMTINYPLLRYLKYDIEEVVQYVHKFLNVYNIVCHSLNKIGLLGFYKAGYISLDKQYLTIGINGIPDAFELEGYTIDANDSYIKAVGDLFQKISDLNAKAKIKYKSNQYHIIVDNKWILIDSLSELKYNSELDKTSQSKTVYPISIFDNVIGWTYNDKQISACFPAASAMYNTELVPAENLGGKNAKWCRKAGMNIKNPTLSSYVYFPNKKYTLGEQMRMHGTGIVDKLDGGSALHSNRQDFSDQTYYKDVFQSLIDTGCSYFTENVRSSVCNKCNKISPKTLKVCEYCGSDDISYAVRVIGYLSLENCFGKPRRDEAALRKYSK